MDTPHNVTLKKLVYSGDKFRQFLQRYNISYKDAAETLGIDKNTVGKAVRGGNMNVDIILRICNTYNLNIVDFFKSLEPDEAIEIENYYLSSDEEPLSSSAVSEPIERYKKCENFNGDIDEIFDIISQSNAQLRELASQYEKSREKLEEIMNR